MRTQSPVPAQLRRRRSEGYRCQPLDDGRHDPIDRRRRPQVAVRAIGTNTVEFTGADWHVAEAIRAVGAKHMRAIGGGAWLVQQAAAEDVLALLEHRGAVSVVVTL